MAFGSQTISVHSIPAGLNMWCGGAHPGFRCPSRKRAPSPIHWVASGSKPVVPSPVSPKVLQDMLQGYDNLKGTYLFNGFTVGFNRGCLGFLPFSFHTS